MPEVTVLPASLAGLVRAWRLTREGQAVRVTTNGGDVAPEIDSVEVGAGVVDGGALIVRDSAALASLHGFTGGGTAPLELVPAEPRAWWIATESKVLRLPPVHVLGIPSAPLAREVVAITGRRAAWRGMLDTLLPGPRGARVETLDELVRVRMGSGIAERLMTPVVEAHRGRSVTGMAHTEAAGLRHRMLQQNSLARAVMQARLESPENSDLVIVRGGVHGLRHHLVAQLERLGVTVTHEPEDHVEATPSFVMEPRAVVTLGIDRHALAVGKRDAGVVVDRHRHPAIRRVLDLAALWPSEFDLPGLTVLRVEADAPITTADAIDTVGALWPLSRPHDAVRVHHLFTGRP